MRIALLILIFLKCTLLHAQNISTAKPWTYWWWMGSAVSRQDITSQLEYFKKSGLGGAHIIPIYGVKGYESKSIDFLSPQWMDILQFTVQEGRKLGLGIDLTTGTGWPFGGPNVPVDLAAKNMTVKSAELIISPTNQKVKRAAPGGEGFVLDPFHPDAMFKYLTRFDSAFSKVSDKPRSMYMDSYEAYGANWTTDFLERFQEMRGYDLRKVIPMLIDSTGNADADLVKIDYHQTLSDLLLKRYALPWAKWSTDHGFLTRYQAHGSPGNLLDLYAASDIPETESFGTSRFTIPGLRIDPDYSIDQFGTPNPLAMKFASSAANLMGKKLVSSETGTWLANHFKVSLSQVKPQVDELFVAGINHIFYHGTTYSPDAESYPGWLFYASTHFGKTSHFAEQFPLLNNYVEKCQTLLQDSKPDNDVLVYFPIHDLWATKAKSAGNVHLLEVHHVDRWLLDLPFGKLSQKLWSEGYAFDYVSDLQLKKLNIDKDGNLSSGNGTYKTLLIPAATYLPSETLAELKRLATAGVRIIFDSELPSKVTGYADHTKRQEQFGRELSALIQLKTVKVSKALEADLKANGVAREESLSASGLSFIRKKMANGGKLYFVTNLSNKFSEGWIHLGREGIVFKNDPMAGKSLIPYRNGKSGKEFFLSLASGQSCFLQEGADVAKVAHLDTPKKDFVIPGNWDLKFLKGNPALPSDARLTKLESWTALPDSAEFFSGTASYKITFDLPENVIKNEVVQLDLGDVRETAKIRLNGTEIGTLWCIPYRKSIDSKILKRKNNILEIEVTNLSANYMRLRDRQMPDWKKFKDINIVDITYKKFDASKWEPMPSGLLGPVKLTYE